MSAAFNENSKRGRLWIEDLVINGAKLEESLEEFGISVGQVVYVEYATSSNQWPTDNLTVKLKQSASSGDGDNKEYAKTSGLYNLGNSKCLFLF
jgi:hypothetical protein